MSNGVSWRYVVPIVVVVAATALLASASATATSPLTRVSQDRLQDSIGYHQTEVQPVLASGLGTKTLVSVFEVGDAYNGGASAIGWATSTFGGKSWDHGLLPATTIAGGPSGTWRGADPSVAYNARYNTWIAVYTALGSTANTLGL